MLFGVFFKGPELFGRKRVCNRQVLVPGWGIVVCRGEGTFRIQHRYTPFFQPKKGNRTRDFMHQMPVYEKDIRAIVNASDYMGIPDFVKEGLAHGSILCFSGLFFNP